MKVSPKFFEYLKQNQFYLPDTYTLLANEFYSKILNNLNLNESIKGSFLSQIAKLTTTSKIHIEFFDLVRNGWNDFLHNKILQSNFTQILNGQEESQLQEFLLTILLYPSHYNEKHIDSLYNIFTLVLKNNGAHQVISRKNLRFLITQLQCSKILKLQCNQVQYKLEIFFQRVLFDNLDNIYEGVQFNFNLFEDNKVFTKEIFTLSQENYLSQNLLNDLTLEDQTFSQFVKRFIITLILSLQQDNKIELAIDIYSDYLDYIKDFQNKQDYKKISNINQNQMQFLIKQFSQNFIISKDFQKEINNLQQQVINSFDYKSILRRLINQDNPYGQDLVLFYYEYAEQDIERKKEQRELKRQKHPDLISLLPYIPGGVISNDKEGNPIIENSIISVTILEKESKPYLLIKKLTQETRQIRDLKTVTKYIELMKN